MIASMCSAPNEAVKAQRALALLNEDDWTLSVQVLQEFYVQATRVTVPAMSHRQQFLTYRRIQSICAYLGRGDG